MSISKHAIYRTSSLTSIMQVVITNFSPSSWSVCSPFPHTVDLASKTAKKSILTPPLKLDPPNEKEMATLKNRPSSHSINKQQSNPHNTEIEHSSNTNPI